MIELNPHFDGKSPGRKFVQTVVAGRKLEVDAEFDRFERFREMRRSGPNFEDDGLDPLRESPLFTETLYRLRRNFTLYLFLPVERGRHRLLRMSFDEPTSWKYQMAMLGVNTDPPRGLRHRDSVKDVDGDPVA